MPSVAFKPTMLSVVMLNVIVLKLLAPNKDPQAKTYNLNNADAQENKEKPGSISPELKPSLRQIDLNNIDCHWQWQ